VVSDYWVYHGECFLLIADLRIVLHRNVFRSDWFLSLRGDRRLVCGLVLIDLSVWFFIETSFCEFFLLQIEPAEDPIEPAEDPIDPGSGSQAVARSDRE
jgi:hypothetical protein